jgi:hypothetical protein
MFLWKKVGDLIIQFKCNLAEIWTLPSIKWFPSQIKNKTCLKFHIHFVQAQLALSNAKWFNDSDTSNPLLVYLQFLSPAILFEIKYNYMLVIWEICGYTNMITEIWTLPSIKWFPSQIKNKTCLKFHIHFVQAQLALSINITQKKENYLIRRIVYMPSGLYSIYTTGARLLVFCVLLFGLMFVHLSFGHCIVCPSFYHL